MLPRTLEPEVMDTQEDAMEYDAMDHSHVNRVFVEDLLQCEPLGRDVLDVGTGTALIPVELCARNEDVRVMAYDASVEMLEVARFHLESKGLMQRIQLQFGDAKTMIFQDAYFDTVMSNSIVHHIPEPEIVIAEMVRVLRPGGLLFVRDLYRPDTEAEVEHLVDTYARGETDYSRQLLRQSFHAALRLDEIQAMVGRLGFPASTVTMTSDRHWTWNARKA
ncbi:MAG: class I SAM-dependent methyltransferase [Pirellulales bacterium]